MVGPGAESGSSWPESALCNPNAPSNNMTNRAIIVLSGFILLLIVFSSLD
jgi:hypothetical protein